jgi:adhesin HecA-like repeat protein
MWKMIASLSMTALFISTAHAIDIDKDSLAKIQEEAKREVASAMSKPFKVAGNLCLDVAGDIHANGTNVHTFGCNDAPNQKWRLDAGRLMNEGGKCLDVAGDVNAAGTNVQIFDCNDAANQKWRLEGGRLVNQGGKCLDAAGDVNAAGTNVQIFDCNDAPNQKWAF